MFRWFFNIIFWLSVVFIFATDIPKLFSQDTTVVKLKSHYIPKVCDKESKKEMLFTVNIGNIKGADSLYAYDFLVKYDNSRVKPTGVVLVNTMSETAPYRDVNLGFDSNLVRMYAYNGNYPFVGSKELIGFVCTLNDDCTDDLYFELIDCDLTEDYNKPFTIDSVTIVSIERDVNKQNRVGINFDRKEVVFDEENTSELSFSMNINPYIDIEELYLDVNLDNSVDFEVYNFESINENATIDYISKLDNKNYEIKLNIFGDISNNKLLKFNCTNINSYDYDITANLIVSPREFDYCHCYSDFISDTTTFISKAKETDPDTNVNVVDYDFDKEIRISYDNDRILIENNSNSSISNISIYDILGNRVYNNDVMKFSKYVDIYNNFNVGTYIVNVTTKDFLKSKILVIYN